MIRNVTLLCVVCFSLLFTNFTYCNLPFRNILVIFNDIDNKKTQNLTQIPRLFFIDLYEFAILIS